jgi:hypothetical protein
MRKHRLFVWNINAASLKHARANPIYCSLEQNEINPSSCLFTALYLFVENFQVSSKQKSLHSSVMGKK